MAKIPVFFMLCLVLTGNAFAVDKMRIQIRTGLPQHLHTVGDAAQYYADVIGYRLVTQYPAPDASARIAREPVSLLAHIHPSESKIKPVEDAILSLLDERYVLVIDHDHKLFSFETRGQQ